MIPVVVTTVTVHEVEVDATLETPALTAELVVARRALAIRKPHPSEEPNVVVVRRQTFALRAYPGATPAGYTASTVIDSEQREERLWRAALD